MCYSSFLALPGPNTAFCSGSVPLVGKKRSVAVSPQQFVFGGRIGIVPTAFGEPSQISCVEILLGHIHRSS
jgi:hypothetical protein